VLAAVPKVLDPEKDSGAEEADPYVLALAVNLRDEKKKNARIVTEGTRDLPSENISTDRSGFARYCVHTFKSLS